MENEVSSQQENPKSFFADLSWKAALILAAIGFVSGGGAGGVVASKTTKPEGLTQDTADVRYLTIDQADKRADKRDKQLDRIERKIESNQEKAEIEQKEQMQILLKILEQTKYSEQTK